MRKTATICLTLLLLLLGVQFTHAQATPVITIISPENNEKITIGRNVVLNYEIGNFTFVNQGSSNPSPNAGYAVVWVYPRGEERTESNSRILGSTGFVNLGQFDRGNYKLEIELFRPDGSEMEPRIQKSIDFSVGVFGQPGIFDEEESGPNPLLVILATMVVILTLFYVFRKRVPLIDRTYERLANRMRRNKNNENE